MAWVLASVSVDASRKPFAMLRGLAAELDALNTRAKGGCCAILLAIML